MITLSAGTAKAVVLPEDGAALGGLWAGTDAVLRPWPGQKGDGPFALACNLLLPFSNRISGGGFAHGGHWHAVPPNLPGEACPIHGDGFQRAWQVEAQGADHAALTLTDGKIGPFAYAAIIRYHLTPQGLSADLSLTNRAGQVLPYGLGFHPWFPRGSETRLQFRADGRWPETAAHLPATTAPVPMSGGGPWASPAPLPEGWINEGFSGWPGEARIVQGPGARSLRVTARGLDTVLLYSPSGQSNFFCFEPVSHPVDAHNLPGQPGLIPLPPGQSLSASMTLAWDEAAP